MGVIFLVRITRDRLRDSKLCALGYRVIRIWNNDVTENLEGVLQSLLPELEQWPLTPLLSPPAAASRTREDPSR